MQRKDFDFTKLRILYKSLLRAARGGRSARAYQNVSAGSGPRPRPAPGARPGPGDRRPAPGARGPSDRHYIYTHFLRAYSKSGIKIDLARDVSVRDSLDPSRVKIKKQYRKSVIPVPRGARSDSPRSVAYIKMLK